MVGRAAPMTCSKSGDVNRTSATMAAPLSTVLFQRLLPQIEALAAAIEAGGRSVREFAETAF
jgi:hypothetical protein